METTDYQALHAHLLDMLGAKDHRDAARIIGEHHARELREREVGGADKPAAWLIPRIVTFSGVVRTSCPDHLRLELEGTVAWEASLIGDAPPVTDKHGVTHHAAPLYTAPRAAVPDAVRFACWLVDHVEREMVTEESVQQWLSDYLTALESFLAGCEHVPAIGTPIKVEGDKLVTDRDTLHASPEYARQVAGAQRLAQERVQAKGARPRPGEEPSTWRALQSLECPHKDENAAHIWQDAILTAMRLMLDHAEQAKGAQGEAVAWLHTVTQGDGETDQALSFSPDSFPLDKQLGFRSLVAIPLYTAPRAAVPDGWKLVPVEPTEAMIVAGGDASASDGLETDVWDAMLSAAPEASSHG